MANRLHLLFWCAAVGVMAFVLLDFWSARNAPLYKRFERQWAADVRQLEHSGKIHPSWFDVGELEVIGGTPETREWLQRVRVPLKKNERGGHKLEALIVVWEENGIRGVLVQYNMSDRKTGNMIFELGRTLILSRPQNGFSWKALVEAFAR